MVKLTMITPFFQSHANFCTARDRIARITVVPGIIGLKVYIIRSVYIDILQNIRPIIFL